MMVDDLVNLRLSKRATSVAETLFEHGYFDDRVTIAKLGFSYAISHYYGKFDPWSIEQSLDAEGSNYNVGSLDGDKCIAELILSLYPGCSTPYRLARSIICYGLDKLGDLNDRGELFPIYELL